MAVAAVSLCLAVLFVPTLFVHIKAEYQTSTAESRTITLEDGSRVQLAAASALTTDFANGRRNVKVLKGEAFFDVVPDSDRPFVVEAKNLTVQVLGTAFDVDMTDGVTQVALAHGSVEASFRNAPPTRLVPGEMLVVDASGTIRKETVPVEDIGGWRNGELYVVDATIGSVVEQIQRYHPAWLTMADKTLAEQRVTGFYNLRDPDRALEALVEPYKGKVYAIANTARIITRF
ncbi:fec operon regulator FecR [compost metagenome]